VKYTHAARKLAHLHGEIRNVQMCKAYSIYGIGVSQKLIALANWTGNKGWNARYRDNEYFIGENWNQIFGSIV